MSSLFALGALTRPSLDGRLPLPMPGAVADGYASFDERERSAAHRCAFALQRAAEVLRPFQVLPA